MKQLIEKLTNKMDILYKENQALKDNHQNLAHHEELSASEHLESWREEEGDNDHEERKHM